MEIEEEIYREMSIINEIINEGEYQEALDSLRNLETNYPDSSTIRLNRIGFLVDIGVGLEDPEIVDEGLVDVEELLQEDTYKGYKSSIHYNAANGYTALQQLKNKRNRNIEPLVENEDLQNAKRHFREALESAENLEPDMRKKIWTNYGNCLDSLGRTMEALYAYDEVLKSDPCFSMAFGNKAMALRFFADISGAYRGAMYIKSFQMLKSIIEKDDLVRFGGVASKKRFENEIKIIENLFEDRSDLYQNLEHPPYDITNATDCEKFYIDFCSKP
jgi:tetratricopeptide (TPR) repeat protein